MNGVTGSCHELKINDKDSILIDCGLFQGADRDSILNHSIKFPVDNIKALIITHVHIDHCGRIPYLISAGFKGPIILSEASSILLPIVLEDALKIGFTDDRDLIKKYIDEIKNRLVPLKYSEKYELDSIDCSITLKDAGHIMGSSYVEFDFNNKKVVFSGDLGAPFTPILSSPKPPANCDVVVLESTYGSKVHENRSERKERLKEVIVNALENSGVVIVPAFSIGRTQELLYELEELIYKFKEDKIREDLIWDDLEIIVDSPLASRFTETYKKLKCVWDGEAQVKLKSGRDPLSFDQLTTVDSHKDHLYTVKYLKKNSRPCIVIAAGGMCTGGRVVRYIENLIENEKTDILFIGYQSKGTTGRTIQKYGKGGFVYINNKKYLINAGIYTIGGYSAHADKNNLVNFIKRMKTLPKEVRLVHGEHYSKIALKKELLKLGIEVTV